MFGIENLVMIAAIYNMEWKVFGVAAVVILDGLLLYPFGVQTKKAILTSRLTLSGQSRAKTV